MRALDDFMVVESPLIEPMMGHLKGPIMSTLGYDYRNRPHFLLRSFTGNGVTEQRLSHFLGMEIITDPEHAVARPMTLLERKDVALTIGFEI